MANLNDDATSEKKTSPLKLTSAKQFSFQPTASGVKTSREKKLQTGVVGSKRKADDADQKYSAEPQFVHEAGAWYVKNDWVQYKADLREALTTKTLKEDWTQSECCRWVPIPDVKLLRKMCPMRVEYNSTFIEVPAYFQLVIRCLAHYYGQLVDAGHPLQVFFVMQKVGKFHQTNSDVYLQQLGSLGVAMTQRGMLPLVDLLAQLYLPASSFTADAPEELDETECYSRIEYWKSTNKYIHLVFNAIAQLVEVGVRSLDPYPWIGVYSCSLHKLLDHVAKGELGMEKINVSFTKRANVKGSTKGVKVQRIDTKKALEESKSLIPVEQKAKEGGKNPVVETQEGEKESGKETKEQAKNAEKDKEKAESDAESEDLFPEEKVSEENEDVEKMDVDSGEEQENAENTETLTITLNKTDMRRLMAIPETVETLKTAFQSALAQVKDNTKRIQALEGANSEGKVALTSALARLADKGLQETGELNKTFFAGRTISSDTSKAGIMKPPSASKPLTIVKKEKIKEKEEDADGVELVKLLRNEYETEEDLDLVKNKFLDWVTKKKLNVYVQTFTAIDFGNVRTRKNLAAVFERFMNK